MRKVVLIGMLAVLAIGLGLGASWYFLTPHTPDAQFAAAEKMEHDLRAQTVLKTAQALQPKTDATIEQYRRVWTRFGKNPKSPEALERIVKIHEEVEKDNKKALADLEQLAKEYPGEEYEGYSLLEQADLIRKQADELKADGKPEAGARYRDALAKLEEFRKKFDKSDKAIAALMEIGRIWQDGIEDPPIHAIDVFQQVLKDYPRSEFEPEAIYRLAKQYEKIKEFTRAQQLYTQLLQEYPKCKWAADATYAQARLLADEFDKHDEAAKAFDKMAQDFPDDPRAQGAAGEAKKEKQQAAEDEGQKYGQSRYGGSVPIDTSDDKPLPPAELLKQFTAQKLDAQMYDLNVALDPPEHRLSVTGTLTLLNKGDDKKELLLMLGSGLKVASMTMDGTAAQTTHKGQTLQVVLPAPLKKDGQTTLGFSYSGQYADASMMKNLQPGPGGGTKGSRPGTAPGAATTPATSPGITIPGPSPTTTAPATAPSTAAASKPADLAIDPQMALGDYGYALSGASWYPITIIGDVFDAHVTITTPPNLEAVCNGAIVAREKSTTPGTPGRFEFQTHNPVFGLYFAYGPYVVQDQQVGAIHFYTYFHPEHAAKHDAYVAVANRILSFYAAKFAPFPYEKMAVIEAPLPPFLGGVGPASLMFLQDGMVDHPEVPETLLAHELAHQWFGNLIPINITDPGYNQWLSEGFATYCDALYTEYKDGPTAFALHIQKYQQLYFQLSMLTKPTAIRDTLGPGQALYRPIVYEKGALVLHMLRKVMGDDKFFQLMRKFVADYRNQPTTTDDFRRMASAINGADLSWFFAEWYDRAVYAHWKVNAVVTPNLVPVRALGAAGGVGGASTKVTITQPDDLVTMPADITLLSDQGDRVVIKDVLLDKKENVVEAKSPFVPVKVIVDEDNWVLKRPGPDNIWPSPRNP